MHRREVFSAAAFAGVARAAVPHEEALEQASDRGVEEGAHAVDRLTTEIHGQRAFPELDAVREAQKTFLRATFMFTIVSGLHYVYLVGRRLHAAGELASEALGAADCDWAFDV